MQFHGISERSAELVRVMAGDEADRFVSEIWLPALRQSLGMHHGGMPEVREVFIEPFHGLRCVYAHYAFARRGKDRTEMSALAVEAFDRTSSLPRYAEFLRQPNASALWVNFESVCAERRKKPMEQLNRGVIAGMAELAQEIYREDGVGSLAEWVVKAVLRTGRLETQFMRMVDVRGIGPKLASVLMRDISFLYNLEERIDPIDRLYIQPVDKFLRVMAKHLMGEDLDGVADWILAGKLSKYARKSGVSGVRLNMGATHFGMRAARQGVEVSDLLNGRVRDDRAATSAGASGSG